MSSYRFADITKPPLLTTSVTGSNLYQTNPVELLCFQSWCFQVEWTGTPTGTITVYGSLDGTNFRDFGVSVATQPAGSASGVLIPIYASCMKWLQLNYTNSSGSGVLTVTAIGKTR